LREIMSTHLGIERDAPGLNKALAGIAAIERAGAYTASLLNIMAVAKLAAAAALQRQESRGAHFRTDFPQTDANPHRTFIHLSEAERIAENASAVDALTATA
jgi:L-aspartate oxidase